MPDDVIHREGVIELDYDIGRDRGREEEDIVLRLSRGGRDAEKDAQECNDFDEAVNAAWRLRQGDFSAATRFEFVRASIRLLSVSHLYFPHSAAVAAWIRDVIPRGSDPST